MRKLKKFAALLVASTALLAAGGVVHAADGMVTATAKPAQIVDTAKKGVIHLTKYDDAAGKKSADGTQQTVTGATPLEGIEFTLRKIKDVDFSTNDGLKAAAALDAATLAADVENLTSEVSDGVKKTNAQGQIDFDNLDVGAYLLVETNSTAADGKTYRAAAPSIVFVPTTDPANEDAWLTEGDKYAVWVYPKNSLDENVKAVVDANKQVGDDITFTVSASLPAPGPGETINDFGFYDKVDPKLDINGKEADVKVTVGDTELTRDTGDGRGDFKVGIKDGGEGGQDELTVILLPNGLVKANAAKAANASAQAVLTFDAKVLASGVVPNQALVYKNTGVGEGTLKPTDTPPTPEGWEKTNTTTSAWGKVTISKVNEANAPLAGAEFQVYSCTVDASGKGTVTGQPISVNGVSTFTDEADGANDGKIVIDGLHVNDAENGADKDVTSYCLVETKAPDNYELRHDPIPVKVQLTGIATAEAKYEYDADGVLTSYSTSTTVQELNTEVQSLAVGVDVVNIPVKTKLPATGGAGIAIFGLLGAAVIGGGLYAAKRNNRETA